MKADPITESGIKRAKLIITGTLTPDSKTTSAGSVMSDCANLVIRRYDDESSDYSNLPNYLTTIYGLRG